MTEVSTRPPQDDPTPADQARASSRAAALVVAVLGAAAVIAMLAGWAFGATSPLDLGDPGVVVRWALPPLSALLNLTAAGTIGAALLQAMALAPGQQAWGRAGRVALVSAVLWANIAAAVLVFSAASVAGLPLNHPGFPDALWQYVTTVDVGRLQLWALGLAAVTALVVAAIRQPTGAGWAFAAGLIALIPTGLSGHAAGPGHEIVASAWWLHAGAAAVWVGGLFTLVAIARRCAADGTLTATVQRYSAMATWAYVVLLVGGVAGAIPRLGGVGGLASGYGLLLIAKAAILGALGVAGWWQRRRIVRALAQVSPRVFVRLAGVELVLMAAAFGLAGALGRTPPPDVGALPSDPTPAEVVTGVRLPPPLTVTRLVTEVSADVLWLVVGIGLLVGYLMLVARLRARGDRWPLGRTICWTLGCLALLYATCGGLAVYGRVLFSIHMIGHMALSMIVPPLLVFGAPVTLVLRGCAARKDGSFGAREWLLTVLDSRYLKVIAHPVVAGVIFTGSLVVFYYSPLFGLALRTHLGHELMMIHFLLAGYLFTSALVGVDPAPVQVAHPLRLLLLFITMAFHAFFAVSLMSQETLLQATYFSSLGWGIDALADQREGGAIAWGIAEVPTLLLALVVVVQWSRSEGRAARRADRAADRTGDAELAAYNAMLTRMSDRDRR